MCLAKWEDGRGYNWHVLHGSSLSAEHLTPLEMHMEDGVLAACRVRLPGFRITGTLVPQSFSYFSDFRMKMVTGILN